MTINNLLDLNGYRSAPILNDEQNKKLLTEIENNLEKCDWITVGVMAEKDLDAIRALYSITERYKSINFHCIIKIKKTRYLTIFK